MIQRVCDVPDCANEAPFTRQDISIPVLSGAVHDREDLNKPKIVFKKHDLCEKHYNQMLGRNLFSGVLDEYGNYRGIEIPEVTR